MELSILSYYLCSYFCSFNNERFISPGKMKNILGKYGKVQVLEKDYNAFKGSRNLSDREIKVREHLYMLEKR